MPDKGKNSTSATGSKGRASSSSHSSISNSGRSMSPTTHSMQARLSGNSPVSSPQAQAGPSRGTVKQGRSRRLMTAAATRGSHAGSSDEDDDDDDDDDDSEDDSDDSGDEDDQSDDDGSDIPSTILRIFAMVEPNGLVKSEILDSDIVSNGQANNSSYINRKLLNVVVMEARRNQPFCDAIKKVMTVPGDKWSLQMYDQLRARLEITISRFDRSSSNTTNPFDVSSTSKRLECLIKALRSMTQPSRWRKMQPVTGLKYFCLVLDVLRYVVASDRDHRVRPPSGGSSPYVVDPPMNHNLYQRMVCTSQCAHAMVLLDRLFSKLQLDLEPTQADQIRGLYNDVKAKDRATHTAHSGDFVVRLRQLSDAVAAAPRRS